MSGMSPAHQCESLWSHPRLQLIVVEMELPAHPTTGHSGFGWLFDRPSCWPSRRASEIDRRRQHEATLVVAAKTKSEPVGR